MPYELASWSWTEPSRWRVKLTSGSIVDVWADGFEALEGYFVFTALVDAERTPDESILVVNRTPTNPLRLDVALARFPVTEVSDISSA
jgi:hypothetical protein